MQVNELISEHSNTMSNTILSNNGVTIFIPQKVTKQEIIIRSQATKTAIIWLVITNRPTVRKTSNTNTNTKI